MRILLCGTGAPLLLDFRDDAGADRATALADREAQALVHGDRLDQLDLHVRVVARHDHLLALRELDRTGHVRRAEVELRAVVVEERRVPPALVLREDVDLRLELRVRRDRARLGEYLPALDLLALGTAQERTSVVAGLGVVERLLEHLEPGDDGLRDFGMDADDLDLVARLDLALLDAAGHDGAAAGDREDVLDRHQERLVGVAGRLRDVGVDLLHQLEDLPGGLLVALERLQSGTRDDRDVVARELVLREELADLHLDELEQLGVVDHVGLVQEHDDVRHLDLAREQDVLPRLRHRAVGGRDHQDRAVHLRGSRDHVLDVVGVAGAVDVRVVTVLRLVLDVRGVDRDAALLLLRRVVDLLERLDGRVAALLREHLRDRGRERGPALRRRAQVGCVAKHGRERHARPDRLRVAARLQALDAAAARVEIAHHVAEVLLGRGDLDGHDRLEQLRLRALHGLLEGHRAGDLEGDLARVDVVIRAFDELDPDVDDGVAREDPRLHRLLDAEVDRRDVLTRDLPADDLVDELVPLARLGRARVDHRVAVLAAAAGLADELALDLLDGAAERLPVGDLRPAHVGVDRELAQQPVDDDLEVELAHA